MCLVGVFLNYLLGGCIRLLAAVQAKMPKGTYRNVFVGAKGVEIVAVFVKASLAYLAAFIISSTEIFGIKIDKTSFLGFGTLGFMVGFWPVEKLWGMFQTQSGADKTAPEH